MDTFFFYIFPFYLGSWKTGNLFPTKLQADSSTKSENAIQTIKLNIEQIKINNNALTSHKPTKASTVLAMKFSDTLFSLEIFLCRLVIEVFARLL